MIAPPAVATPRSTGTCGSVGTGGVITKGSISREAISNSNRLWFAELLSAGGIPIVVLKRNLEPGGPEFIYPSRWQNLTADGNAERLARYEPGDGVIALTGSAMSVIDVDIRNGGNEEKVREILGIQAVRVFAEACTPGGGCHFYVDGHPDLKSVSNGRPFGPGVDVLSTGRNVFIHPTQRPKYDGLGYVVVYEDLDALFDGGDPDGASILAGAVQPKGNSGSAIMPSTPGVTAGPGSSWPEWDGQEVDGEQLEAIERSISGKVKALSQLGEGENGGRNKNLYDSALSLFETVGVDRTRVRDLLTEACQTNGLVADTSLRDVHATLNSAERKADAKPLRMPLRTPAGIKRLIEEAKARMARGDVSPSVQGETNSGAITEVPAAGPSSDAQERFWTCRPELALIRERARQRMVAPWAVFVSVLVYAMTMIDPKHVLPAVIGGRRSLNFYAAIVGKSGTGKDAAKAVARELLVGADSVFETAPGSGEGVTHLFARGPKDDEENEDDQPPRAALLYASEVDTLTTLGGRSGSTLMSVTRSAWDGAALGHAFADKAKAVTVPAHQYRLTLWVGVQPERAAPLLDQADGGTPQRFLWAPATDPDAVDPGDDFSPEDAVQLDVLVDFPARSGDLFVPASVRAEVRAARLARLRGADDEDERFAGHLALSRLKVAQGLAFLAQRRDMNDENWDLAGTVIDVSEATRQGVERALRAKADKAAEIKGRLEGRAQVAASRELEEATGSREAEKLRRVGQRITELLSGGPMTRKVLRQKFNGQDRKVVAGALDHLVAGGVVAIDGATIELVGQ